MLARAAWLVIAVLSLGLFFAGLPARFAELLVACPTAPCLSDQLRPAEPGALRDLGLSAGFYASYGVGLEIAVAVVYSAIAGLIFWRRSADRMALFVSLALLTFGTATFPGSVYALATAHPAWWPPVAVLNSLGLVSFGLFLYLVPDGRFVPRWTRWVALAWLAWQLSKYWIHRWPMAFEIWSGWLSTVVWLGALGAVVFSQVYRYRRVSNGVQRQQTKWVVFGITLALTGFLGINLMLEAVAPVPDSAGAVLATLVGATIIYLGVLLIPLSIGIAILRHHLFDIDLLINRTLVYGALTVSVVGIYVLVVGYLGASFHMAGGQGNLALSVLATGLVALLFQPLRNRLQRGVNRLMYGERDDPYTVLSRLGRRLKMSLTPEAVLPTVVTTVREVLKLPYVAIYLKQGHDGNKVVAESASPSLRAEGGRIRVPGMEREGLCVPLIHQGETLGYIVLGPRAPNEAFSSTDLRLLDDLAPQVGAAVHAVRLTADLQRSREQLILAREEERRRLRRDLHDGLGPTLASLVQLLDTARVLIARDPDAAVALLDDLKGQVKATIADIRRLVYALRPPVLDELGLASAIGEHIGHYNQPNGLQVSIDAPDHMPSLPAAVEVAAYHIALEAVTNVARHARAQTCHIRLLLADGLCLEITDDGDGLPADFHAGVGLTSMRERAAELGGECRIEPGETHGTRVWARLPLPTE